MGCADPTSRVCDGGTPWLGPYNLCTRRYLRSTDGQIAMDSIQGLYKFDFRDLGVI